MSPRRAHRIGCPEFHRLLATERRSFIKTGLLGLAGLSLSDLLRCETMAASGGQRAPRQNSAIILWMRGGPSQHETWDPKPDAPIEYRGEFGDIPTRVPGIRICDLLPMSARIMHKWSIIPNVFSAAIAGGGVQGGRVIGSSDDKGAEPASNPKTPQDVLATLYRHLGVNTASQYPDHSGRPHPVLPSGSPIEELF